MQELLHSLTERWHTNLLNNKSARKKLAKLHKLDKLQRLTSLDIGLVDLIKPNELTKKLKTKLEDFGLQDDSINGMISIPLRNKNDEIINYYFLSIDDREDRILKKGGLANTKAFRTFKSLVLVNNMKDFLIYYQNVNENIMPIFPDEEMINQFKEMYETSKLQAFFTVGESPVYKQLKSELEVESAAIQ
jgi:hypothetical protein